jgi:integrative and conjugative element protein (TIGR02256 family)
MSALDNLKIDIKCADGLRVKVSSQVLKTWGKFKQTNKNDLEACGVLIGGYCEIKNEIYVESCTMPEKEDERTRTHFKLKSTAHQRKVNHAHRLSDGTQFYLGTWHSHPERNPAPSSLDLRDWKKCMKRNPEIQFFIFAIIGTDSVAIHPYRQKN